MPDPADPTPVKAVQRGSSWSVIDKNGSQVKEGGNLKEAAARALAATINSTWASAKKERVSKGGPAITEAIPGEKTLEVLEAIEESVVGMLSHWKAELHPRGRAGEFTMTGKSNPLTTPSKAYGRADIGRSLHYDALKAELARVRAARPTVPARDLQKNIFAERAVMAKMHDVRLGKANEPAGWADDAHFRTFSDGGWSPNLSIAYDKSDRPVGWGHEIQGMTQHTYDPTGAAVKHEQAMSAVAAGQAKMVEQPGAKPQTLHISSGLLPRLEKELRGTPLADRARYALEDSQPRGGAQGKPSSPGALRVDTPEELAHVRAAVERLLPAARHENDDLAWRPAERLLKKELAPTGKANTPVGNEPLLPGALTPGTEFVDLADARWRVKGTRPVHGGKVRVDLEQFTRGDWQPGGHAKYAPGEDQGFRRPLERSRTAGVLSSISTAAGRSNQAVDPDGPYTIQVFGGDVGGFDQDFEADTLKDAIKIARAEHPKGARETDVYDRNWNHRHSESG